MPLGVSRLDPVSGHNFAVDRESGIIFKVGPESGISLKIKCPSGQLFKRIFPVRVIVHSPKDLKLVFLRVFKLNHNGKFVLPETASAEWDQKPFQTRGERPKV